MLWIYDNVYSYLLKYLNLYWYFYLCKTASVSYRKPTLTAATKHARVVSEQSSSLHTLNNGKYLQELSRRLLADISGMWIKVQVLCVLGSSKLFHDASKRLRLTTSRNQNAWQRNKMYKDYWLEFYSAVVVTIQNLNTRHKEKYNNKDRKFNFHFKKTH